MRAHQQVNVEIVIRPDGRKIGIAQILTRQTCAQGFYSLECRLNMVAGISEIAEVALNARDVVKRRRRNHHLSTFATARQRFRVKRERFLFLAQSTIDLPNKVQIMRFVLSIGTCPQERDRLFELFESLLRFSHQSVEISQAATNISLTRLIGNVSIKVK